MVRDKTQSREIKDSLESSGSYKEPMHTPQTCDFPLTFTRKQELTQRLSDTHLLYDSIQGLKNELEAQLIRRSQTEATTTLLPKCQAAEVRRE